MIVLQLCYFSLLSLSLIELIIIHYHHHGMAHILPSCALLESPCFPGCYFLLNVTALTTPLLLFTLFLGFPVTHQLHCLAVAMASHFSFHLLLHNSRYCHYAATTTGYCSPSLTSGHVPAYFKQANVHFSKKTKWYF